jgi:predicted flap endonuclease-1-like 5' DNA nuclease
MPALSLAWIGIAAVSALAGIGAGWLLRNLRCRREKEATNAGWQQQIEAQRAEHERLVEQNKNLMQQVSQYKASASDATNRSRELSTVLKEALARRDEMTRELKNARTRLEAAGRETDELRSELEARATHGDALEARDAEITRLSRELSTWQERLPPLLERFRERREEAERLAAELEEARAHIADLESRPRGDDTLAEAVDASTLDEPLVASNDADDVEDEAGGDEADENPNPDPDIDEPPAVGLRDDLKLIRGIGPAIEKTLNELGIFRLHQVADLTDYDVDRIARRLRGFRSRIYREDWIGQARALTAKAQP